MIFDAISHTALASTSIKSFSLPLLLLLSPVCRKVNRCIKTYIIILFCYFWELGKLKWENAYLSMGSIIILSCLCHVSLVQFICEVLHTAHGPWWVALTSRCSGSNSNNQISREIHKIQRFKITKRAFLYKNDCFQPSVCLIFHVTWTQDDALMLMSHT